MIVTPLSGDTTRLRKQGGFQAASRPSQHYDPGVCLTHRTMLVAVRRTPRNEKGQPRRCAGLACFLVCETVSCPSDANSIHVNRYACAVGLRQVGSTTFFCFPCSLWQVLPVRNKITCTRARFQNYVRLASHRRRSSSSALIAAFRAASL